MLINLMPARLTCTAYPLAQQFSCNKHAKSASACAPYQRSEIDLKFRDQLLLGYKVSICRSIGFNGEYFSSINYASGSGR